MDFYTFDDEYVRRLGEGDPRTVEHYYRYFRYFLTILLRKRGVPSSNLDDIIQTTHLRVFEGLRSGHGVRDSHSFGAYVNNTCRNVARELQRSERPTQELTDVHQYDESALRDLITKETQEGVRRTLELLAKEDPRSAWILRTLFLSGGDKDELCRKLGVDRDYLRVLIHRALEKFRKKHDDS